MEKRSIDLQYAMLFVPKRAHLHSLCVFLSLLSVSLSSPCLLFLLVGSGSLHAVFREPARYGEQQERRWHSSLYRSLALSLPLLSSPFISLHLPIVAFLARSLIIFLFHSLLFFLVHLSSCCSRRFDQRFPCPSSLLRLFVQPCPSLSF